jgi:peptidylprolyl isomerase
MISFLLLSSIAIIPGKLEYDIVKKGSGPAVKTYSKPLISYQGKYLGGKTIPVTEAFLDLDETYPGLQKGLLGMQEGEVRTLYIDPEWGDGNGPMVIQVTLIKADATKDAHIASSSSN